MSTLLVVDDNSAFVEPMVNFLHKYGHHEVAAVVQTGEAALEQLRHLDVDLVLVDVSLPNMSGIDFVAAVHEQYPAQRCLMLSGHSEVDYARRALAAGACGYVTKGHPQTLLDAIPTVLTGEIYLSDDLRGQLSDEPR